MEAAGGSVAGADPHRQTVSVTVLNERGGLLGTKHFKVWCRASGDVGVGAVVRSGYSVRIENASGIGRHTAMFLIERGVDVRDVCPTRTAEQGPASAGGQVRRIGRRPDRLQRSPVPSAREPRNRARFKMTAASTT
jgi:hypothetical protein